MIRYLLVLALAGCAMPTSPTPPYAHIILDEWQITLRAMKALSVDTHSVRWHNFSYRKKQGMFPCGDVPQAYGCYHPHSRLIEWNVDTPRVLRHEMGHGILHKLGYKCWREYQHSGGRCPK